MSDMALTVGGFHHITAISKEIETNIGFYTGPLGLQLVKRSVNQDDTSAYHLFYADKVGSPGTDITFFDWPLAAHNRPGAGAVGLIAFAVEDTETLDWWEKRLSDQGVAVERDLDILGREHIAFADPEGQALAIVVKRLPGEAHPWEAVVPGERALRGFAGIDLVSANPDGTRLMLELLGFELVDKAGLFSITSDRGAAEVGVIVDTLGRRGFPGAGGVHHVAFRVRDDDELNSFQKLLEGKGFHTSGFVDRFWFHSLYFREPGGVLFELATDGPGFGRDETMLGQKLALPPFLEDRRTEIEAKLKPLPQPAYAG